MDNHNHVQKNLLADNRHLELSLGVLQYNLQVLRAKYRCHVEYHRIDTHNHVSIDIPNGHDRILYNHDTFVVYSQLQ